MKKSGLRLHYMLGIVLFLAGVIPAGILLSVSAGYFKDSRITEYQEEAVGQMDALASYLTENAYLTEGGADESVHSRLSLLGDFYGGEVMVISSDFKVLDSSAQENTGRYLTMPGAIKCISDKRAQTFRLTGDRYFIALPVFEKQDDGAVQNSDALITTQPAAGAVVMVMSMERITSLIAAYDNNTDIIVLLWALVMAALAVFLTWVLLIPFDRMYQYFTKVSKGDYTLPAHSSFVGYRETDELTEMVNATVSKLSEVDRARGEFVQNVSHELKTPLTSVKILADSLKDMEGVPVETYREFITDISSEIDRENKIIEDLLSLVKMDKAAQSELAIERTNVNQMLESILKRLAPIAKQGGVDMTLESRREVIAELDGGKMTLAITNVVENAIKYNYSGGWVHVTLDANHRSCVITISDSGSGIPKESIGQIFERFYRVDKARSREVGGTGLGLAITKSIIDLHHGEIRVESSSEQDVAKLEGANRDVLENSDVSVTGTVFTITLPLKYIRPQQERQKQKGKIKYPPRLFCMMLAVCAASAFLLGGCAQKQTVRDNPYETEAAPAAAGGGEVLLYRPSMLLTTLVSYQYAFYNEETAAWMARAAEAETAAEASTGDTGESGSAADAGEKTGSAVTSAAANNANAAYEAAGELIEALARTPEDGRSMAVFPVEVKVLGYSIEDGNLKLSLNDSYLEMRADREILAREAIVETLTQVPGIVSVSFYIDDNPMAESDGSVMPPYTKDSFISE